MPGRILEWVGCSCYGDCREGYWDSSWCKVAWQGWQGWKGVGWYKHSWLIVDSRGVFDGEAEAEAESSA